MALSFDGSTSNLALEAVGLVTGYPFTIFAWTRARSLQAGFAVELALDPAASGQHQGHGIYQNWGLMMAASTVSGMGAISTAYSRKGVSTNVWLPVMVVFSSASLRKVYYGTAAVQSNTTTVALTPSTLKTLSVGKQAVANANYWNGDLACVAVWNGEVSAADYATLAAGSVPTTVQSASLVDYWSLLTQAATQTGVNGRVLTATNTSLATSHPITEGSGDTTAPTLSGAITVSNLTGTGYTLTWPAGSDNVAVTSYERSLDGGSTWTNVGNVLTVAITGRTSGTTDAVRVRARDAAGNVSSALAVSVTLPDTVPPVMAGTITVSAVTSTTYTLAWPAASDNVAVVSYDVSLDGGTTYTSVGKVLTTGITGRTPGATDAVRVRARDAAGNAATPLSGSVTLAPAPDVTPPTMSGTITVSAITSTTYSLAWSAASDNVAVVSYEVSVDGGATYTNVGNVLAANITGRTPGATDAVRVRAKDAAGNAATPLSTTVTLAPAPDTTAPTMTGTIAVSNLTSTSYTLGWSAATDNVGVVSYEYSVDAGSTWTNVGNTLTASVTGRTAGTTDQVRVRARDAASNVSTALSTSVTLATAGGTATIATPPMKNNTGTLLANLTGITVNVYSATTGALVVRKTGLTSNAAGVVLITDAALVAGTAYAYEVVTPSNGRRLPTGTAA